ncbi:hypothetical protein [Micromonospora aurantiaca (nom. illeg.)]|uniref:hypothetical protein n=2 Tax=Micromonospora aurantiaca (nom. illeg.) TaxID=47850 RepID=UPI003EBC9CBC
MEIAGSVKLAAVMAELATVRPVFHSEADFQHAFAWTLHRLAPSVGVRLEVPQDGPQVLGRGRRHLDLLCLGADGHRTAIELKYFTRLWVGADPHTAEPFHLRGHEATDLGRQGFVFDIARLEQFCVPDGKMNGFAVMLSNDERLWNPAATARRTRDHEFRINEGRTLTGMLRWGIEGSWSASSERHLFGSYPLAWQDYSEIGGTHGTLRWLAVEVKRPVAEPYSG